MGNTARKRSNIMRMEVSKTEYTNIGHEAVKVKQEQDESGTETRT